METSPTNMGSSAEAHTGKYIFDYVDRFIGEIGCDNVIQVVTDNATNNMAAAKLLKLKRPNIFWTSCATHTLNLILEGIGKTPRIQSIIEKAKALTIFMYAHHTTLALMRKFTRKRDIVRPGITRFASSFLTLQSILEKEEKLKFMFLSKEWGECKWSSKPKGIKAYQTIVSQAFWVNIAMCVELFKPLVKVLRLVDGDWRPSMAFVYGEIKEAKNEIIKVCKNSKETYEPILEIIDSKMKGRLDSPLHLAGYLLNPYYYYKDKDVVGRDASCMAAVLTCIEAFFPDNYDLQDMVGNVELLKYKNMEGMFGRKLAIMGRSKNEDNFDIVGWWSNYGAETPNLQKMALKIVSLTSSSSGCERNWSTFEGIHTKKRNRLDVERLNNLVYVQFNAKLVNKKNKMKEKRDVLLAADASQAQGWIVEGGDDEELSQDSTISTDDNENEAEFVGLPRVSSTRRTVRELDEDNFESEDELDGNITFDDSDHEMW